MGDWPNLKVLDSTCAFAAALMDLPKKLPATMAPSTRRSFLGLLGTSSLASLTGCIDGSSGDAAPVTIEIGGEIEAELTAELEVVAADVADDLSENVVYKGSFEIGPDGPEDAFTEIKDAFVAQRAMVRVLVAGVGVIEEYTFVPDCQDSTEHDDVLYVTFRDPFTVTFRQNRCR